MSEGVIQYCFQYASNTHTLQFLCDTEGEYSGRKLELSQIIELNKILFPQDSNNIQEADLIRPCLYIFILDKNKPIGMFILEYLTTSALYLMSFGIIHEYRGKGIGRLMYELAVSLCKIRNKKMIFDCGEDIAPFYKKLGANEFSRKNNSVFMYDN